MRTEYWKKEGRTSAEQLLADLSKDGKPHEWLRAPMIELKMRALASQMSRKWPSGDPVRWEVLRHAINECITGQRPGLAALEDQLDAIWAASRRSIATGKKLHRIVIAVEFAPGPGVTLPITVESLGRCFEIRSFTSLDDCFGKSASDADLSLRLHTNGQPPPAYAVTEVSAASAHLAIDEALDAFMLWRSILNFAGAFSGWHIQFVPQARADVPPPRWVVSLAEGEEASPVTYGGAPLIAPKRPAREIGADRLQLAAWLLKPLVADAPESSTVRLLADGFRIFGMAVDQEVWHQTLLVLWQLAEHLTVIDGAREKHDEICKRLPQMRSPQSARDPALVAVALRDIMHMRHAIVHRGAFGTPVDDDVSFLQDCCTEALWWLAKHHETLQEVEQLRIYFQYASATETQVGRVQHVLSKLPEIIQRRNLPDDGAFATVAQS
ncbi:MAG: hypothetical protein RBS39_06175 [Phycisphaerales bacterium]|jgi:hypothetical protein|nr:hypothetical protein [Phycisphaerales bacterium]